MINSVYQWQGQGMGAEGSNLLILPGFLWQPATTRKLYRGPCHQSLVHRKTHITLESLGMLEVLMSGTGT